MLLLTVVKYFAIEAAKYDIFYCSVLPNFAFRGVNNIGGLISQCLELNRTRTSWNLTRAMYNLTGEKSYDRLYRACLRNL